MVQCSFVKICLKNVLDLLNPANCSVQTLSDNDIKHQGAVDDAGNKEILLSSSISNSDNNG